LHQHDVIGRRQAVLAGRLNWPYLNVMARPVSPQHEMISPSRFSGAVGSAIAWGGAGLGSIILLGTLALWFHYGTAVFFEMIGSGISACF
jgi:hypothetical protein